MSPDEMLAYLSLTGGDAGSDFNDSDEIMGWFGWRVNDDVLTVSYEPIDDGAGPGPKQAASWRLVPIAPAVSEPAGETT